MTTLANLAQLHSRSSPPRRVLVAATLSTTLGGLAQLMLMASLGYLLAWSAARPTLGVIAGILTLVELLAFFRAPLRYLDRLRSHAVAFAALRSWRLWLFRRLIPLSPGGLGTTKTGDVLATAMSDVDGLGDLYIKVLLPILGSIVPFGLGVALIGWVNVWAAVIVVVVCITGLAFIWTSTSRGAQLMADVASAQGQRAGVLLDALQGAATLTAANGWDRPLKQSAALEQRVKELSRARELQLSLRMSVVAVLSATVMLAALFAVGSPSSHLDPRLFIALLTMTVALSELVGAAATALGGLDGVLASWSRLQTLAGLEPATRSGDLGLQPGPLELQAQSIALAYRGALAPAFCDLSFSLKRGTHTVITGPSGSGKTSVLVGLLGLWPLTSGQVFVNNVDLVDLDHHELRGAVGTHLAQSTLFSGTVRSNLEMTGASEEQMSETLEAVGLRPGHEFLNRVLFEQGRGLSGGEQLRVSVVRALLGGKSAVFIDEPVAQLDETSAGLVMLAISQFAQGRTIVTVSHERLGHVGDSEVRLSSLR